MIRKRRHSTTIYARRCVDLPAKDPHLVSMARDIMHQIPLRKSIHIHMIARGIKGIAILGITIRLGVELVKAPGAIIISIGHMAIPRKITGTLMNLTGKEETLKRSLGVVGMLVSMMAAVPAINGGHMITMTKSIVSMNKSFSDNKRSSLDSRRRRMKGPEIGILTEMSELRRR